MYNPIKRFRGPAFTATEWSTINPLLLKGEVGYLLEGGVVIGSKVGPGRWNDLLFSTDLIYPYTDTITNPIGDATGNQAGTAVTALLHKMLNPYQAPAFSSVQNNAGGVYAASPILEIGASISGSVSVSYTLSNQSKLVGGTPINATAGGIFNNEGNFPVGTINLGLSAPLVANSNLVTTYLINLIATHQNGTALGSTSIRFYPKIMWAISPTSPIVSGAAFMSLTRQTLITNNYKQNYNFSGNGYSVVAIPNSLNPTALQFTDVTNPNLPANYSMEDLGLLSINNGVGTYMYRLFISTFYLINPTILKIS